VGKNRIRKVRSRESLNGSNCGGRWGEGVGREKSRFFVIKSGGRFDEERGEKWGVAHPRVKGRKRRRTTRCVGPGSLTFEKEYERTAQIFANGEKGGKEKLQKRYEPGCTEEAGIFQIRGGQIVRKSSIKVGQCKRKKVGMNRIDHHLWQKGHIFKGVEGRLGTRL